MKSYVQPGRDSRPNIPLMVSKVDQVEWFLTEHEKEAFILENNLIKSYRPKYNIVYRDDKSYVSLKLTKHNFPRLYKTRYINQERRYIFRTLHIRIVRESDSKVNSKNLPGS